MLTSLPEFDLLIIMGGLMGAYEDDAYPWLSSEKALIREAIVLRRKVLGICLGAQLIAAAMGAKVYRNTHAEIGFHPITVTDDLHEWFPGPGKRFQLFQWHGDTFDLPAGARLIATSENTKHQAFSIGHHVLALQFHPEMDSNLVKGLLDNEYLRESESPWKQSPGTIVQYLGCTLAGKELLFRFLDKLTSNADGEGGEKAG